ESNPRRRLGLRPTLRIDDGWAYARLYESTEERNTALPGWLHFYNYHRAHSALGGQPPVTRLTNLPGHHT
ncbi:integrase core domain-containing protein, partial [Mycolicibacterium sp. CBMA 226]|uniref:integrase core domain-containing protein n=1 Tax=Mycolicibacterium sp. CBMA 226 TaxID=2606611 RepID=UPI0012DD8167